MRGSTHLIVGVASGVAVASLLHATPLATLGYAVIGGIGGLLPDIDHMQSTLGRRVAPVSFAVQTVFGHRTLTHGLAFWCVTFVPLYLVTAPVAVTPISSEFGIPVYLIVSLYIGALLHIFCDMLTVQGVPLFYPLMMRFRVPLVWRAVAIVEPLTMLFSAFIIGYFGIVIPLGL